MMVFWMLLGGAAGINITQRIWRLLGIGTGAASVAVPVGGVAVLLARQGPSPVKRLGRGNSALPAQQEEVAEPCVRIGFGPG
jgi:hypothetical protein